MYLINKIKICLIHTILIINIDALSIEKCKTPDCQFKKHEFIKKDLNNFQNLNNHHLNIDKLNIDQLKIDAKLSNHQNKFAKINIETQLNDQPIKTITQSNEKQLNSITTVESIRENKKQSLFELNRSTININETKNRNIEKNLVNQKLTKNQFKPIINLMDINHQDTQNKKNRTKREPRGGRIGSKNTGGTKRTGAKQDGSNDSDDDSGTSTIKPIFLLVSLSVLFLFI